MTYVDTNEIHRACISRGNLVANYYCALSWLGTAPTLTLYSCFQAMWLDYAEDIECEGSNWQKNRKLGVPGIET